MSRHAARRSACEGRQEEAQAGRRKKARAAWRAQAYLNGTLSTASKRNEVLVLVSRASTVGWREMQVRVHWPADISSGANQPPPWFSRITRHETRITAFFRVLRPSGGGKCRLWQPQAAANGFSRITKHETRITAFYRNTAFPVARMVPVGTEALQSCFFRSGMLGVRREKPFLRSRNAKIRGANVSNEKG